MARIILIALMLWTPIASAVCEARCVVGVPGAPAHRDASQASGESEHGCHQHSEAPEPHDSSGNTALDCCCIAGSEPAIGTALFVNADDPGTLMQPMLAYGMGLGRDVFACRPKSPPGALNSSYLQHNPHLLI